MRFQGTQLRTGHLQRRFQILAAEDMCDEGGSVAALKRSCPLRWEKEARGFDATLRSGWQKGVPDQTEEGPEKAALVLPSSGGFWGEERTQEGQVSG